MTSCRPWIGSFEAKHPTGRFISRFRSRGRTVPQHGRGADQVIRDDSETNPSTHPVARWVDALKTQADARGLPIRF
jgi:hypothetical protein